MPVKKFVEMAMLVHGSKYGYDKCPLEFYPKTKITISCPKHGDFALSARKHLSHIGCPKCRHERPWSSRRLTTEEFIVASQQVHGDRYDYSETNYSWSRGPVTIICRIHGQFTVRADQHLYCGSRQGGCQKCAMTKRNDRMIRDTPSFVKDAISVHGDRYDYSRSIYTRATDKLAIICPVHGEFWQTPIAHLYGHGCLDCSGKKRKSSEEFIQDAITVHGDKYDYSKVEYTNHNSSVTIGCPVHGWFVQKADIHLFGCGCQKCKASKGEMVVDNFLQTLHVPYELQKMNGCKNPETGRPLKFDFYIPSANLLIEYDGEHHFMTFRMLWEHTAESLAVVQHRDRIKDAYVLEHKIWLLRIRYDTLKRESAWQNPIRYLIRHRKELAQHGSILTV